MGSRIWEKCSKKYFFYFFDYFYFILFYFFELKEDKIPTKLR
jgi:hypothetical protein